MKKERKNNRDGKIVKESAPPPWKLSGIASKCNTIPTYDMIY
jgi:hypothetical protein